MASTDLVAIVRSYLERTLREVPGMKVLLLDAETTRFVSTVLSQSDILDSEVFLVDRIDAKEPKADKLPHLRALAFLRPTRENIARLRRELRDPRFGAYHLYFTNRVDDMRLQDLAEGDTTELIASVQEMYSDFLPLEGHHATIPLPRPHVALAPPSLDFAGTSDMITRLTEGVAALALALRRRFSVRYQHGSEIAARVAHSLHHLTTFEQRELFDFGLRTGESSPLLLVLDRRDDPVTPLLTQWTYQAMIHDILGLHDNRCSLRHVLGIRPELAEAVLSPTQDPFFKANMYTNFGDAGMAVKSLVDAMSSGGSNSSSSRQREFQSLEDMASFVEALPDVTAQQGLTAKHVTLMSELSHAVDRRQLMQVSGLEQELACQAAAPERHFEAAAALVHSPALRPFDKARLAALYALRYEGSPQASALVGACADEGVDAATMSALRVLLKQCGSKERVMDIFSDRTFTSRMATLAKQHLKGVENVYTQHTPPLVNVLERAVKGRLTDAEYPRADGRPSAETTNSLSMNASSLRQSTFNGGGGSGVGNSIASGSALGGSGSTTTAPPRLVLVFIIGGTTYEEAKAVAELNASADRGEGWAAGVRFLLAGTGVQSSATFLNDLAEVAAEERFVNGGGGGGGVRQHVRAGAGLG